MQDFINLIVSNLAFFTGVFVFAVVLTGLVLGLSTTAGRDALGKAAIRFAIAALKMAETWLGLQIIAPPDTRVVRNVPVRDDLARWLADYNNNTRAE